MINGVQRLTEMMDTLPNINVNDKSFNTRFDFGTQKDLNKWLKLNRNRSKYPLVWLLTPVNFSGDYNNITGSVSLVISTLNKDVDMGNRERIKRSFNQVIDVVDDNVLKAFKKASTIDFILEEDVERTDYYNYSEDGVSHNSTDIVDARRLEISIGINNNCLRPIRYE